MMETKEKSSKTGGWVYVLERSWAKKKRELCSRFLYSGADNEIRTRDPQLGKLMLYQLSYVRAAFGIIARFSVKCNCLFLTLTQFVNAGRF